MTSIAGSNLSIAWRVSCSMPKRQWVRPARQLFCAQCGRPASLFGYVDVESGWIGWCDICNWKWYQEDSSTRYFQRVQQVDLREIHRRVNLKVWRRFLLGNMHHMYVREWRHGIGGEIRECDTDDETDSGVTAAELDFVNPIWKCQLARPDGKPFDILVRMLGKPLTNSRKPVVSRASNYDSDDDIPEQKTDVNSLQSFDQKATAEMPAGFTMLIGDAPRELLGQV